MIWVVNQSGFEKASLNDKNIEGNSNFNMYIIIDGRTNQKLQRRKNKKYEGVINFGMCYGCLSYHSSCWFLDLIGIEIKLRIG